MRDHNQITLSEPLSLAYERAREAFDSREWAETIRLAAQILATVPHHAPAFELLNSARRNLERQGSPAGEQRILSVLMCDLVDSARLPRLLGREQYQHLLRDVQEVCATAVTRFEGRIAQYLGDGILAYFSYPQAHEDDPLRATLAALTIVSDLGEERTRRKYGAVDVAVRIGIDLGTVIVGVMGAGNWTLADSIIGDPPNFAARLQAIAPRNGIIASATAYERITPHVRARALRARQFKGFDGRRKTYEVLAAISALESSGVAIHRGPLIGRDAEHVKLTSAWREVLDGQTRLLALVGEAGMGKTRLADELVNVVKATGGAHISIRCTALYRHVPFHPVAVALRWILGLATGASLTAEEVASCLQQLAPGAHTELAETIAQLLGAPLQDSQLPEQRRERTLTALVSVLHMLMGGKPYLLLVEDIHDADPSTVELLGRIVATRMCPTAVLITARPQLGIAAQLSGFEHVNLGPLTDEACHVLASRILNAQKHLVSFVVMRASGSPLFAKELAQWLARGHTLTELPPGLDLLLTARLDSLAPKDRELLVLASVIGPEFALSDLAELAGRELPETSASVLRLINDGLLELDAERVQTSYRFRHALYRDSAYRRLPPSEAARQHLKLAAILEQCQNAGRLVANAVIAQHLQDGGALDRALTFWHCAALDARATAAHAEAVQHYESAIALLSSIRTPEDHARLALPLHLGMAESASMIMGYTAERVLLAFEQANSIAETLPPSSERFVATMGLYTFACVAGQLERAEALVASGLRDSIESKLGLESNAYAAQAFVRFYRGRISEARELCVQGQRARALVGLPQDAATVSRYLCGLIEWLQGHTEPSEATCAEALRAVNTLDGERAAFTRAFLLNYRAWHAQLADDPAAAHEFAKEALLLSQEHGFRLWYGSATMHLGIALCELGELSVGLAMLEPALEAWQSAGAALLLPYFLGRFALAKHRAQQTVEAVGLFDSAIARARLNNEHIYLAELYRLRALCRIENGDAHDFVRQDLDRAITVADQLDHHVFAQRARADKRQVGDTDPIPDRTVQAS